MATSGTMVQKPDPFRKNRPHRQEGGTDVAGFRNPTETIPGHRMRKDLGQHFLRDTLVLQSVVGGADLQPGQRVLEVGPGPGNLTERLAKAVGTEGTVVSIEADPTLAAHLQGKWPNVQLVVGDAVQVDLASFGRFDRIVANLPYLISGPITIAFLDLLRAPATRWDQAVLMYQAEFAQRLLAKAGDGSYGRLSVHAARWVATEWVRDVHPAAFDPPPKVDSMVVRLIPHPTPPFEVKDEALWRAVVDGSFQQRRKQMRNTVPDAVAGHRVQRDQALATLESIGLSSERPEQVPPATFAELANRLAEAGRGA
ncbi:MAG TPA: 16S rRNA (adenine(1518)-N(6)/adenine(1519)-N(6))-dimethyltransferase RsmA [Candidatus Thermoplasmatota archaeon]|nr:16S rRNA (adenine(1518)-N(6)/adenine(1519)-N(6))-dimethyltransferase RsmA [Candidatus Thermoplasmatota archaeon]